MTHPTHGIPHPTQGHTMFHLRLREEPHTHLMGTPNSWASSPHTGAHNVPSPSQRGTTHPSHGHTQLMGSLSGRLTQSVSWRMSHTAVIINTNNIPKALKKGLQESRKRVYHRSTTTREAQLDLQSFINKIHKDLERPITQEIDSSTKP
jgi:hypothetical protein